MTEIHKRVANLRQWMRNHGVETYIFPTTDPHASEYTPDHWKVRHWLTGFEGSAGTAVVTMDKAALWTDSRYWLQAESQLADTPFSLMRDGHPDTPSVIQWLCQHLPEGSVVGADPQVNTMAEWQEWCDELQTRGHRLEATENPADTLWTARPELPTTPVEIHPMEYAGESVDNKLLRLRKAVTEAGAEALFVTALDEVAWLTNLRGGDVHCTPVFVSYVLLTQTLCTLYVDPRKVTDDVVQHLSASGITLRPYEAWQHDLRQISVPTLMLSCAAANQAIAQSLPPFCRIIDKPSPIATMKAVKNEAEIAGMHLAMRHEGVALVRLLRWLPEAMRLGEVDEMAVDRQLTAFRRQSPLFRDLSFDTIAAYGQHAAIVHYEATDETAIPLQPRGFLLLDCGGQYACGTTDVTRTIPMGPLTDEERRDYTLCLKGHLRLAMARFPEGTTGTQLDVLARYAMWQEGINYGHGTGHGVGSRLSVHEGPHQIRMQWRPSPLQAGMTVTNEPGIYRPERHGIRIENTMLVTPAMTTEFGSFLQLQPLTLCPIDLSPVLPGMLTADEVAYLRWYHSHVYDTLSPLLQEEEREWLKAKTLDDKINL